MSILMKVEIPGATTAQYDRTNEIAGIRGEADAPDGLVSHVCGVTDDGILIVDVWESEELLNSFFGGTLGPAMGQAGMPEAPPQVVQVHNIVYPGGGSEANVIMLIEFDQGSEVYDAMAGSMESHQGNVTGPWTSHVAAVKADGGMLIVDLWESPEAFGAFAESQIGPAAKAAAEAGHEVGEITPRFVPVHNYIRGRAAAA